MYAKTTNTAATATTRNSREEEAFELIASKGYLESLTSVES
jgi:hypothetical protein